MPPFERRTDACYTFPLFIPPNSFWLRKASSLFALDFSFSFSSHPNSFFSSTILAAFCAGFSLTAGVAALCWYSNYRFRQAVQLSSYRSILSEQTDPFSIRCAQDHFWGRQQVYLKNNSGRTFAYLRGCIQFWDRNTLVHTVSFALEQVAPRRAILLDTLYAKQDPLYLQKSIGMRFRWIFGSFCGRFFSNPAKTDRLPLLPHLLCGFKSFPLLAYFQLAASL